VLLKREANAELGGRLGTYRAGPALGPKERQVEWARRHYPGTAAETRFTGIAWTVLDDCEARRLPGEAAARAGYWPCEAQGQ
jgi:hypothetical protein